MKKLTTLILISTSLILAWYFLQSDKSKESREESLQVMIKEVVDNSKEKKHSGKTLEKKKKSPSNKRIKKNILKKERFNYISKELRESEYFRNISNYTIPLEKIASVDQADEFIDFSKSLFSELATCLLKNLCDQEKTGEYFDPQNTEAHNLIIRSLNGLLFLNSEGSEISSFFDYELELLLKLQNDMIESYTLEIISQKRLGYEKVKGYMELSDYLTAEGSVSIFSILEKQSKQNPALRGVYMKELKKVFKGKDQFKAVILSKSLINLSLSEKELMEIAKSTCSIYGRPTNRKNGKVIHYHMALYAEGRGGNFNIDEICKI